MTDTPTDLADRALADARADRVADGRALDDLVARALDADEGAARSAAGALFGRVVEPLCDSFTRPDRDAYYRLMARVIGLCRQAAPGARFDAELSARGLLSDDDLLDRVRRLTAPGSYLDRRPDRVHRLYFLSRVTLGADVAITSVGIRRMIDAFPDAEIAIVGGGKLADLFGGNPAIRLVRLDYPRRGGLLSRLDGWLAALDFFAAESLADGDLVIDADTRITQVGLLPVADDSRYLFFEGVPDPGDRRPLGAHFGHWLDQRLGSVVSAASDGPYLSLRDADWALAESIFARAGIERKKAIAVSLGVGENAGKRIGAGFERELVRRLIDAGCAVVLDRGFGDDEAAIVRAIEDDVRAAGGTVAAFDEDAPVDSVSVSSADLVTWRGGVGPFATLIGRSFGYAGYDSLFQHVAAALAVPVAVCFAGYPTERFADRWRPLGPGPIEVVRVAPGEAAPAGVAERLAHVLVA